MNENTGEVITSEEIENLHKEEREKYFQISEQQNYFINELNIDTLTMMQTWLKYCAMKKLKGVDKIKARIVWLDAWIYCHRYQEIKH